MDREKLLWFLVGVGDYVAPVGAAIGVFLGRWPRSAFLRVVLAVLLGWVVSVVYTAYVYNPAGIAHGRATGVDSPEMRYDNNTIASALLSGWMLPAIAVGVGAVARRWRAHV